MHQQPNLNKLVKPIKIHLQVNGQINNLDRYIQLYVRQGKHQVFPSMAQEGLTYQIQKNFIIKIIYSIILF